jgi:hypothetical protein
MNRRGSSAMTQARDFGVRNIHIAAFLLLYAGLRLALLRSVPMNSDEPQHAHVAWALSQGLVPYRDVFDNHTPLFHVLYAPVVAALEHASDVLLKLRLAIIPVAVAALAFAAAIGTRLWDRGVALWGIAFASALPTYLLEAGEFRTDALWAAAWIATVAMAVCGRWTRARAYGFGLLAGTCFAISMKSTLLLSGFLLAWSAVLLANPTRTSLKRALRDATLVLAGCLTIPAAIVGWVATRGGLAAMRYGVIEHNMISGLGRTHGASWRLPLTIVALALALFAVMRFARTSPLKARRALVVGGAVVYLLLLYGTWPLLTRQDLLPVIPLLTVGLAGWWRSRLHERLGASAVALVVIGILLGLHRYPPWIDRTGTERATLAEVLSITTDRDPVMDDKGAAIFRMRPFYFALEDITLERMRRGLIVDDIPDRLVQSNTHVIWMRRLPKQDAGFVAENYVPTGNAVMVAGRNLEFVRGASARAVQMRLPGVYALVSPGSSAPVVADIDGTPYTGPRWLGAGAHMIGASNSGAYVLVWQPAAALLQRNGMPRS